MDLLKYSVLLGAMLTVLSVNAKDIKSKATFDYVPNELIVKFKEGKSQNFEVMGMNQLQEVKSFRSSGAQLIRFPKVVDVKQMIQTMTMNDNIEYVELNHYYYLNAMPNDPEFEKLYGLHNEGKTGGNLDADIDAPEAWEISTGSHDILVGVIDTGVDYNHEDLAANIWTNPGESGLDADGNDKSTNGIDDDGNGYIDDFRGWDFFNKDNDPMDGHSHGTHVSGTIGAVGDNATGVAGVNWNVSIVGIKIFSDRGRTTADAIIEAIEYSTTIGVDVTNNSWGGGGFNQAIFDAISEANDKEIFFIAAAGNSRSDNDSGQYYPSNYELDNIISVAATDHYDSLARFSSYGNETVEIAAPGVNIYSTTPGNRYGQMSGTSMATPHVTGLVALVKSVFPDASLEEIRARIVNTGDKIDNLSDKLITGARINALNSLDDDTTPPNAPSEITIDEEGLRSINMSWNIAGDDGAEGVATSYELRISEAPITEENFGEATKAMATMESKEEGRVSAVVTGLPLNYSGYVAVRALDNIGNAGDVSESVAFQTREVQVMFENFGEDTSGFTAEEPWGVEMVDENSVLTESPNGNYADDSRISLVSDSMAVTGGFYAISFDHGYDFENNYDHGHFQVAVDGGDWQDVASFTGKGSWSSEFYDLTEMIDGASHFQFRFQVSADGSASRNGWQIDNISVMRSASNFQ